MPIHIGYNLDDRPFSMVKFLPGWAVLFAIILPQKFW